MEIDGENLITDADLDALLNDHSSIECNYLNPEQCEYPASHTGPCPGCDRDMFMCVLHVTTYLEFLETAEKFQRWVICKICGNQAISQQLRDLIRII